MNEIKTIRISRWSRVVVKNLVNFLQFCKGWNCKLEKCFKERTPGPVHVNIMRMHKIHIQLQHAQPKNSWFLGLCGLIAHRIRALGLWGLTCIGPALPITGNLKTFMVSMCAQRFILFILGNIY